MKNRSVCACAVTPVLSIIAAALTTSLCAQTIELNPVVISASRTPQPLSDVLPSVSVITRQDIEKSQAPTLADLLQGEAGFEFGRNGGPGAQTSYFLRGQNSTNVVVLVDGVRTQTDSGGNLTLTDIPLALIDRIEVLRGNASALYGEAAVGGVINIYTRQFKGAPVAFGSITVGSRNTIDVNAGYAGTVSDYNFALMAGKASTDGFSAMDSASNSYVNPDKDGYSSQHASFKVDKKVLPDLTVGIRVKTVQSNTDYDSGYGPYEYQPGVFTRGDLSTDLHRSRKSSDSLGAFVRKTISDAWVSTIDISKSKTTYQETTTYASPLTRFDSGQYASVQDSLHWSNQYELSEKSSANFGVDVVNDQHEQKNSFDLTRKTRGIYAGVTHRFDELTAQFNIRQDQIDIERASLFSTSENKTTKTTGLFGLGYQLTPLWKLTATVSNGFKAPSAYDISTNPNVSSENYQSKEAGLVYSDGFNLGRVVYFSTHTGNAIGYNLNNEAVNIGETNNKGFEATLRTSWLENNVRFSYVDQKPWNVTYDSPLDRRARHYGAMDISRSIGAYEFGGKIYVSSSRPEFGSALAGYTLLTIYGSRKITDACTARIRLENVTNQSYQLAGGYNTPGRGLFMTLQYSPK